MVSKEQVIKYWEQIYIWLAEEGCNKEGEPAR